MTGGGALAMVSDLGQRMLSPPVLSDEPLHQRLEIVEHRLGREFLARHFQQQLARVCRGARPKELGQEPPHVLPPEVVGVVWVFYQDVAGNVVVQLKQQYV